MLKLLKIFIVFILILWQPLALFSQDEAGEFYQKGVDSKSLGERDSNFEKALKLYLDLQIKSKENSVENGYLHYNIANCYFNLNQLGEAILYYKQALKYLPNDEEILQNYEIASKKRVSHVDIESNNMLIETLLFFHYSFTQKTKVLLVFIFSLLVCAFYIFFLMLKKRILMKVVYISVFSYGVMMVSLFVNYYYPNKEGVLIKDSFVVQEAGDNYARLNEKPYGIGSTIRVLNKKGEWYQVRLNDGRLGYIKESSLMLVL